MKRKLIALFTALTLTSLLSGCVIALGNKVPDEKNAKGAPTLGKQLTDLKQARDSGAITEDEYQTAKKRLMDSAGAPPAHRQ
jgi:hypothetical protein